MGLNNVHIPIVCFQNSFPQLQVIKQYVSNEKKTNCLGYIGDYTTQLYGDYDKPLQGSLVNNRHNGK